MKLATAAYPLDPLDSWQAYVTKLTDWVARAAGQGAELLVFPEYGAMELAMLDGPEVAGDLERSLHAVSDRLGDVDALHAELASRFKVHILAASAPCFDPRLNIPSEHQSDNRAKHRPVNRSRFFAPGGTPSSTGGQDSMGIQDKQIMTRFEREEWHVAPGGPLRLFDTRLGKIGILICYDSEFPLLGHALSEADVILVPSCTETLAGYSRVRIGAQARALENQCITVMASTVGTCDWSPAVDLNCGAGGVFGPPDRGFPATGVIAEGVLDQPGWTFAEVDLAALAEVRRDGGVLNRRDWQDQMGRSAPACHISMKMP